MLIPFRLGLQDLITHRRLALTMSLVIAIAVCVFAILKGYRSGLAAEFNNLPPNWLTVQESQSFGEIYGSRLPAQVGDLLKSQGCSVIVPEIHEVTGTSIQNATLLRGVDLVQYTRVESFQVSSGRKLAPGDPPRSAMIGDRLAANQKVTSGELIQLRGRAFNVVGIFHTGTYMDNEAWISLGDAQNLLGWGTDVSIYIVPDEGIFHEGEALPGGVSVARKGEGSRAIAYQYQPVIDLMGVVVLATGVATAMALTNITWRLAWLRRREIAILRTTGFPALSLSGYLLIQAIAVTMIGILFGGLAALAITSIAHLAAFGFTINAQMDWWTALVSVGWIGLVMLAGSLLPVLWMNQLNLAQLLHSE